MPVKCTVVGRRSRRAFKRSVHLYEVCKLTTILPVTLFQKNQNSLNNNFYYTCNYYTVECACRKAILSLDRIYVYNKIVILIIHVCTSVFFSTDDKFRSKAKNFNRNRVHCKGNCRGQNFKTTKAIIVFWKIEWWYIAFWKRTHSSAHF